MGTSALAVAVLAQAPLLAQYATQPEARAVLETSSVPVDSSASSTGPPCLREAMLGTGRHCGTGGPDGRDANAAATPPPVFRALFCRFDDDLDAKKIPLRLRAGDLETVNKLERKPGW